MSRSGRVLVLTIGTGNQAKHEETLFHPLEKSARRGEWDRVVLLPSTVTAPSAEEFARRCPDLEFRVQPLPDEGMENDADACFGHFDQVLGNLLDEGWQPEAITADFTRGTKAMSAALVLAAVRRGLPQLRYIDGPRDTRGMVRAGKEQIVELDTSLATGHRLLDEARSLLQKLDFAAVLELLPPSPELSKELPEKLRPEGERLQRLAAFYGTWDRLDYAAAAGIGNEAPESLGIAEETAWVERLANMPEKENHLAMARWLRAVACDLLENGRRRIQGRHFEDAMVRAYRVRELLGQCLLFERGVDSASIDPELEAVQSLRKKLCKKGSQDFGRDPKNGRLRAPKELAARLLNEKEMECPMGKRLLVFDESEPGKSIGDGRNNSILIHGFTVRAPSSPDAMESLYCDLEELLREAWKDDAPAMIESARKCGCPG